MEDFAQRIKKRQNMLKEIKKERELIYKELIDIFCELKVYFWNNYYDKIQVGDILVCIGANEDGDIEAYDVKLIEKTDKYLRFMEAPKIYLRDEFETIEDCKSEAKYPFIVITKDIYKKLKSILDIYQLKRRF